MPVPSVITDLDADAADNFPLGADNVFPELDNYLRAHAAFIAQLHAGKAFSSSLAASSGASLVGFIQDATGATARTLQDKGREVFFSVKDFGATGNGSTDDTAEIQATIDAVADAGGGVVYFPAGTYKISTTILVSTNAVRLLGAGKGGFHYLAPYVTAPTALVWAGGSTGTMVQFAPGGSQRLLGCGFDEIYLDAGTGIQRGLEVYSCTYGKFYVHGRDFSICNLLVGCAGGLATDVADCHQNEFGVSGASSNTGALLQLTGISTANTCFNRFVYIDGAYTDATAVQLYNCDNNIFETIRLYREAGGTGTGVSLAGGAANEECRSNVFIDCSPGAGGVTAGGTPTFVSPSKQNQIICYDSPNFAPLPVIETGATLWYSTFDDKYAIATAKGQASGSYGAGPTDVAWDTEIYDAHGLFSGTTYSVYKPGFYRIKWTLSHTSGATVNDKWIITIVTTPESIGQICHIGTATDAETFNGDALVYMTPGQTAKITIEQAFGSGTWPRLIDPRYNRFEISYVGKSL